MKHPNVATRPPLRHDKTKHYRVEDVDDEDDNPARQQRQTIGLIPSILIDSRITGIIQHIEPNVRQQPWQQRQQQQARILQQDEQDLRQQQQQQQHDVTIALQEQKEQRQQQQKKHYDKDMKHKYRKQKHKYRKERKQIKRRLGRDNKQQRVATAQHKKQQEYFEDFIMKQSRANDVIGSINKLYIDMKNKSVSMLASIPTRPPKKKMKKKKKKRKYEMKRLVLQIIECKIRTDYKHKYTHEQQYKDNLDLFPDNPT